jgi:hypothetical protein
MNTIKRKQFKVYLPVDTIIRFRTFINKKYPSYNKGLLSVEVNAALIRHMALDNIQQQAANSRHNYNQNTGLIQLRERIIDFMVDEGHWPDGVRPIILEKHLRLAIIAIKNLKNDPKDTRSPDKWIKRMLLAGIIKKFGVHTYVFCNAEEDLMANQQTSVLTPVEQSLQSTVPSELQATQKKLLEKEIDGVIKSFQTGQEDSIQKKQEHEVQQQQDFKIHPKTNTVG